MQTPLGSCGLPAHPSAASPACLPFTCCRAAWCCKSREKNRQKDRGPLGRKSGAWEQLGDAARAQAGEAPVLGKGSSWDRSPPGSAHSWRKRHFLGQTSAWEKFQGCLWSAAVAELLGPRATAMVLGSGGLVGWLLPLGSGRHHHDVQMCQAPGWLLGTVQEDLVCPALV